jgi:hypothetical protein
VFTNYDGRGGEPGRDHRSTLLVRMDDQFRQLEAWTFPLTVLARFAPRSASGASWTADDRLAVSGHDHPEIYLLKLPPAGAVLDHLATVPVALPGQAIDWDPAAPGLLWSIDRARSELVASRPRLRQPVTILSSARTRFPAVRSSVQTLSGEPRIQRASCPP